MCRQVWQTNQGAPGAHTRHTRHTHTHTRKQPTNQPLTLMYEQSPKVACHSPTWAHWPRGLRLGRKERLQAVQTSLASPWSGTGSSSGMKPRSGCGIRVSISPVVGHMYVPYLGKPKWRGVRCAPISSHTTHEGTQQHELFPPRTPPPNPVADTYTVSSLKTGPVDMTSHSPSRVTSLRCRRRMPRAAVLRRSCEFPTSNSSESSQ